MITSCERRTSPRTPHLVFSFHAIEVWGRGERSQAGWMTSRSLALISL